MAPSPLHTEMSRWCGDPLDGWAHTAPHLTAVNFPARTELDQSLPGVQVAGVIGLATVHRDVLGHAVQHDPDRDLWFADIDIEIVDDRKYFPFVRLALVRHQPKSAPGCQISSVVLHDPIQLPPMRTLTATAPDAGHITLTVTGPWMNNSRFEAELHSRAENPLLGFSGSASEISEETSQDVLDSEVNGNTITATGTVLTQINGVPPEVPAARLVVRERQVGDSLHDRDGGADRPVYVEIVDQARLRPPQA